MAAENQVVEERVPIFYSDRYSDDYYEYRHVTIPKEFVKWIPTTHLLTETEWRNIGIQQSPGWIHYGIHKPEPNVLLFKREKSNPIPSDFGQYLNNVNH